MTMVDTLEVVEIALTALLPHPQNPRLTTRHDVVEQIAAQIKAQGGFDPAHALLVRPLPEGETYQIIAGHHRLLAAQDAELETVPCWVRNMNDEDAYMALLLSNTQSELHALEEGMHALHSRMEIKAYAEMGGQKSTTLQTKVEAAKVFQKTHVSFTDVREVWRALAAIHPAPQWLWSALVTKMLAEQNWTVEKTHQQVKRFQKLEEPPGWVNISAVATAVVDGTLRLDAIPRFAAILKRSLDRIARVQEDAERFAALLQERLANAAPTRLSDVEAICKDVEGEQQAIIEARRQADLFRTKREEEIAARIAARRRQISLDEWSALEADEQEALLNLSPRDVETVHFNKQDNTDIEWAQHSWNPVTGCLHNCPYCYARDIAHQKRMEKAYPFGFAPTFRPATLLAPRHMKVPKEARTDTRYRNVFTCSMADLFGRWVPAEWIEAVLREIRNAPQWNFLCLTKFPKRAIEFDLPPNAWMGTTVDLQARVKAAEDAFAHITAGVRWLSIEPMLERLKFRHLDRFDWLVIGGASASTQTPEWHPPFAWINDLVRQAEDAGCKIYFKTNLLKKRLLEMPFDAPIVGEDGPPPPEFSYLKAVEAEPAP
jgi:ParB/RepB/Spo0J family partition protein